MTKSKPKPRKPKQQPIMPLTMPRYPWLVWLSDCPLGWLPKVRAPVKVKRRR